MAKKGSKSQRNKPETQWGETKTARVSVDVTPTGKRLFLEKIRAFGMSLAEFIERVARGKIKILVIPDSLEELIDNYNLEKLVEDAGIARERLEEIRNGQTPTLDERIGLCRVLEITHEQLEEAINQHKRKN